MKLLKYTLIAILFAVTTGEAFGQAKVISGKVIEMFGKTAEPMVGVNVHIVNSQNRSLGGTITDMDGVYNLKVPDGDNLTIVFSYIGMKTERIKYNGQSRLNITMRDDTKSIDEVVIQGRRIERNDLGISAREQSSATQKVSMEDLVAIAPVTSIEDALQGQLGGVDIVLGGGDPGARASIQIRGGSTLNANSEPLIVVDGVPYPAEIDESTDFSTINNDDLGALLNISPQDIESIEVLKDAAATAVWGTKGANGVLVIKTKQGVQGKTRFSFSSKFSSKFEPSSIPMLDGNQYTALVSEALWNSANYIGLANSISYQNMLYNSPEIGYQPNWTYFDEYNQNTDWLSEVRRNTQSWENTFSMSGGGERATYRFSLGYLDEGGTTIGTDFSRLNSSLNVRYKFSDKLRFNAQFSFVQSKRNNNYYNVRTEAFRKAPNKSPYYIDDETGARTSQYFSHNERSTLDPAFKEDGKDSKYYNPIAMAKESVNSTLQRESKMNFQIEYDILDGLSYQGYVNMNIRNTKGRMFLPQVATGLAWTDNFANRSTETSSDQLTINTENKVMYRKNWHDQHSIIATALFRTTETTKSSYGSETSGNSSSGLADPTIGSSVRKISSGDSKERSINGVVLLNYTLLNRYIINGSLGMESNSTMGKSERFGLFPTVGLAWHLADEKFMDFSNDWMDEFKFRFSLGQTGNAASGTSLYLGSYASGKDYMNMSAIKPSTMQLNRLKWETTTEYNTGLDASFLKGKLRFTVDVYQKYIKDMLQKKVKMPTTIGYGNGYVVSYMNSGKMTNKGWEFRVDAVPFENKDWRVGFYVNLAHNENKITEMPDNYTEENYSFDNGNYAYRREEGRPMGSFYGYRYKGVYQNKDATYARDAEGNIMKDISGTPIVMRNGNATVAPGDAIYEDINHDGVINQYDIVYLGNSNPRLTGGAGINISYKQFKLSAIFYGRYGQDVVNSTRLDNESMRSINNQSTAVLRRWRNEGDQTDIPRALYGEGYNTLGSDRFVEDASYLRLKTLSLTYRLPKKMIQRWGFSNIDVYVTGYNLLTWTRYTGQDPEVKTENTYARDSATTPASIQLVAGFNLSF
ncbi:TonB-linked outer membrane protein, SusC/RagA family [Bacteroides ovatus]|uniref:TonB-linked outer membrane protein, SusC/RagA family n=1 Tax=Bacteroides ovatus TaxID=28116 RepID=A0A1G6G1N3_BACOV|nr:TonB-dependent receptor [Bacteroides ovatus]SDB75765.1 TonB-linked outer membrane protein, SusC/RagA family [Bacteroides ovatus]